MVNYIYTLSHALSYLFTELCDYSVYNLFLDTDISEKYRKAVLLALPHKTILRQSTAAVNFLHGLGLVHRRGVPHSQKVKKKSTAK